MEELKNMQPVRSDAFAPDGAGGGASDTPPENSNAGDGPGETTGDSAGGESAPKRKRRRRGGRGRKPKGGAANAAGEADGAEEASEPAETVGEGFGSTDDAPTEQTARDESDAEAAAGAFGDGDAPGNESGEAATASEPRKGRRRRGERASGGGERAERPASRGRGRDKGEAGGGTIAKREGQPFTQMIINYVPGEECRVAVVEDRKLEELYTEKFASAGHVGNIYVGKVMNVEPAIQAAFIDFGMGENGFLHVTDLHPRYFPGESEENTTERIGIKTPRRDRPPIQAALRRGDEIIVQVLKEGVGTKGPTLTSYLSIPGRFLVMMPYMDKVGVSRKVEDEEERRKMREILDQLELPEGFGFILRTAGMTRTKAELKRDLAYLMRLWKDMDKRLKAGGKPRLLCSESDLLVRALRDVLTGETNEVIVDNEHALRRAARYLKIVAPRTNTKLLHFQDKTPIFHTFGVEKQISLIHAREVPLPSGGRLVIDQTEALVAIDVNSGKSRDSRDSETNAYQTNIEAVDEICRQLRLRDMGGIVINDLIDMRFATHRKDIQKRFEDRLRRDRAKSTVLPISEFGILELTRQRMRPSHESVHFNDCPTCRGRGLIQKPDSVTGDALRDLAALLDVSRVHRVEMVVAPRVAGDLLSTKRQLLSRIERTYGKHVDVRVSEAVAVDRVTFYAYDQEGADMELTQLPQPRKPTNLVEMVMADASENDWAGDLDQESREAQASLVDPEPDGGEVHPIEEDLSDAEVDQAIAEGARVAPSGDDRRERDRGGRGRGRDRGGDRGGDRGRGGERPSGREPRREQSRDQARDQARELAREQPREKPRSQPQADRHPDQREGRTGPVVQSRREERRDGPRDDRRGGRRDDRGPRGGRDAGGRENGGRGGRSDRPRSMHDDTDEWGEPMTRAVGEDGNPIEPRRDQPVIEPVIDRGMQPAVEQRPQRGPITGNSSNDSTRTPVSAATAGEGAQAGEIGPDGEPRKKRRRRRRRRGRGGQVGPDGQPMAVGENDQADNQVGDRMADSQGGVEDRGTSAGNSAGNSADKLGGSDDDEWGDDPAPNAAPASTPVVLREEAIDDGDVEDDGAVDIEAAPGEAGGGGAPPGGVEGGEGGQRKRRRRRRRGRGGNPGEAALPAGEQREVREQAPPERREPPKPPERREPVKSQPEPRSEPRPERRSEAPRPPVEVAPLPRPDALKPAPRTLYGNLRRKLTPAELARKPKPE